MADGSIEEIEVTGEFAESYAEFEQEEQCRVWRDERRRKRHEVSLERLVERDWDKADHIIRDPHEMLIEQEQIELPLFVGLTDYQQRGAVKYFVDNKTHE